MPDEHLPKDSFADIAVALRIEASQNAEATQNAEVLAARCGLTKVVTDRILSQAQRHNALIASGHLLFKEMCEHEGEIRALLARKRIGMGIVRRLWAVR